MNLSDVDNFYVYHQIQDGNRVSFGWVASEAISDKPMVITTVSKSKKAAEDNIKWSLEEGTSAASVSCYLKYFEAATGQSPQVFLETWSSDLGKLEDSRRTSGWNYSDGEGDFLLSLAELLVSGKKFSRLGRFFKIINDLT